MERLKLAATSSTPSIDFDPETGRLSISGESYPENSYDFFRPVLAWMREFLSAGELPVTMTAELVYLNTSSIKALMDMLDLLEEAHVGGRRVSFTWSYDPENDRALEMAHEFEEEVTLPFFIVPKQPEIEKLC
jgi:sugar/nucleoside kinase (ribokinase family)